MWRMTYLLWRARYAYANVVVQWVKGLTVRRHTSGPGMKSLTPCQANRTRVGMRTVRRHPAEPGIKSLTGYKANRTRVIGVRTVRKHPARSGMKSLTDCQANRTRVWVRTVRRHLVGPGMKSLTYCETNRTRAVEWWQSEFRRHSAVHKITHKLSGQQPEWKWGQSEGTQLDVASNHSQAIRAKVWVRMIRGHPAEPGIKSLTSC